MQTKKKTINAENGNLTQNFKFSYSVPFKNTTQENFFSSFLIIVTWR